MVKVHMRGTEMVEEDTKARRRWKHMIRSGIADTLKISRSSRNSNKILARHKIRQMGVRT